MRRTVSALVVLSHGRLNYVLYQSALDQQPLSSSTCKSKKGSLDSLAEFKWHSQRIMHHPRYPGGFIAKYGGVHNVSVLWVYVCEHVLWIFLIRASKKAYELRCLFAVFRVYHFKLNMYYNPCTAYYFIDELVI